MTPIKVMTFNLKVSGFEQRLPYIRELLNKHPFDILCVQELSERHLEKFRQLIPGYEMAGMGRGSFFNNEMCAIFYSSKRFNIRESETLWLSNRPEKKGSKFFLSYFPRICTYVKLMDIYNNEIVNVYNTHLDLVFDFVKTKQIRKLKEQIKKHSIVHNLILDNINILCGDFNCYLDSEPLKLLLKSRIQLRPVIEKDTIHSRHEMKGITNGKAIDHIFISNRLEVINEEFITEKINNRWPSDHFPLYAELNIRE